MIQRPLSILLGFLTGITISPCVLAVNDSMGVESPVVAQGDPIPAGEIIGVETFDYPDGPLAGRDGGVFWDYDNLPDSPASPGIGHTGITSTWANFDGGPVVAGRQLVTAGNSVLRDFNGDSTQQGTINDPASSPSSDANQVYIRADFITGATLPDFFGISSLDFSTERLFFGKPFGLANFGLQDLSTVTSSTVAIAPNTRYTLVGKVDFVGDRISLFINPDLNAPEPVADAFQAYTGTDPSTGLRLSAGNGGTVIWDNIVVATTWENLGTVVTTTTDEDDGSLGGGTGISLREAVNHSPSGSLVTFAETLAGERCVLETGQLELSGILIIDGSEHVPGVTISGGWQSRIFNLDAADNLLLDSLTIRDSRVASEGGAAFIRDARLRLVGCTLWDNQAERGAAFWIEGASTVEVETSTITDSRSTLEGGFGAIGLFGTSRLDVIQSTIAFNDGKGFTGGIYADPGTILGLYNSIIAGNTANGLPQDIFGATATIQAVGASFIGCNDSVSDLFPEGPRAGTAAAPKDPMLSPLGWFGGPTASLHPLEGSPVLDVAFGLAGGIDQRGFNRVVGVTGDIGAIEAGPVITVTTSDDENDGFPGGGAGVSLREALAAADQPGHRILFSSTQFPDPIALTLGQLEIAETPGLFIDASARSDGVFLNGGFGASGITPTRHFMIGSGATVAMANLSLGFGKAPDGPDDGFSFRGDSGGSIHNSGTLSLLSCFLFENRAGQSPDILDPDDLDPVVGGEGGAVFSEGGRIAIRHTVFEQNRSGDFGEVPAGSEIYAIIGDGGAIFTDGGILEIDDSRFDQNGILDSGRVANVGGGIFSISTVSVFRRSSFTRNAATRGGAIWFQNGPETRLEACTISGNTGVSGSGGILSTFSDVNLLHCTLTGNQAPTTGGVSVSNGELRLEQSILAGNVPDNIFLGFNGTQTLVGQNFLSGDPQLAPLFEIDSRTAVHVPLPGSPVIDAGIDSPGGVDQRGHPRETVADIGAIEFRGLPDYPLFWESDSDFDGVSYGIETALGTNPLSADVGALSAFRLLRGTGLISLSGGLNSDARPFTRLHLRSSTDLQDFSELVFTWDGPTDTFTVVNSAFDNFSIPGSFNFVRPIAPGDAFFYKLEAELILP